MSWSSIGSLDPGLSYLEAIGPTTQNVEGQNILRYIAIAGQRGMSYGLLVRVWSNKAKQSGTAGNITIEAGSAPPLFYVYNGHLWYHHNTTTILPMSVHNATLTSQLPLQVTVGSEQGAIMGGNWRWQGTMLYYELGSATNGGVYYFCQDTNGLMGLFLFLKPSVHTP